MSYLYADTDHSTIEEFVSALARATVYNTHNAGKVIDDYWKEEAEAWVKKWLRERPATGKEEEKPQ